MFISARDMARFGLLTLNRGNWDGEQILSDEWIEKSLTPTELEPTFGFMNWFLNTDNDLLESAPESAFYHAGAGSNIIYVDHDLVIVTRWIDNDDLDEFVGMVLDSFD